MGSRKMLFRVKWVKLCTPPQPLDRAVPYQCAANRKG